MGGGWHAAGSGFVVYLWILDYLEQRRVPFRQAAITATAVLVVLVVNPGSYQTLLADFHLETTVALFALLAGRNLWLGRYRRAWIWIVLTLLCGSFVALTVVGLGVSAVLAGRATWRHGVLLVFAGGTWLAVISALGANAGPGLNSYAYLAGRTTLPATAGLAILSGAVTHPPRVFNQISLHGSI